jgi:hypothetical protein
VPKYEMTAEVRAEETRERGALRVTTRAKKVQLTVGVHVKAATELAMAIQANA